MTTHAKTAHFTIVLPTVMVMVMVMVMVIIMVMVMVMASLPERGTLEHQAELGMAGRMRGHVVQEAQQIQPVMSLI